MAMEHDTVMAELAMLDLGTQVPSLPVSQVPKYPSTQCLFAGDNEGVEQTGTDAESENFVVVNGKVCHKPEPPSIGRINGFEL
jgi:hypothetical protein